jgi:hypothetical protein
MGVEFRCDTCRSVQYVNTGPVAYYTLPDGRAFFGPHGTGWCCQCRLLSEVEKLPVPEVLRERLAVLRQRSDNKVYETELERCTTLLDWSQMRRQPPRCLRCGSANFNLLEQVGECLVESREDSAKPFCHPRCEGVFKVKNVVFSQPVGMCLTPDGEPIDHRWDGAFVRWVRRLSCCVAGRFH